MQAGTEEEGAGLGEGLSRLPAYDTLQVDVTVEEDVDRLVPLAVELLEGEGVPPVLVELPRV
jgi:hypothetical protein